MNKAKIMIVEDDKNQRLLYDQEFRHEGYEVEIANDGKEALEKVQELAIDIIILDINLPKMDGIETMGKVLSINKNIPINIHTAYSNYKDNFFAIVT